MAKHDPRLLGYVILHSDGCHYHDGATWRRLWGWVHGQAVCRDPPKRGVHADKQAATQAAKQLHQQTGEQGTPTSLRLLAR